MSKSSGASASKTLRMGMFRRSGECFFAESWRGCLFRRERRLTRGDALRGRQIGFDGRSSFHSRRLRFRRGQRYIATATIAAALAAFAAMVLANVLRAVNTNLRRRIAANTACEDCGLGGHLRVGFPFCCINVSRHRCASRSAMLNSCSFCAARSVRYCRSFSRFTLFSPSTARTRSASAGF